MSQTLLEVANSALTKVGATRIASLTSNTKEAQTINARIRATRDFVLKSHIWTFAKTHALLTSNASTVPSWAFVHAQPTDCLRLVEMRGPDDSGLLTNFEILGRSIYCNHDGISLRYIAKPAVADEATDVYPEDFAEAWSCFLASDVSIALFDSADLRDTWFNQYNHQLRIARFNHSIEQPLQIIEANEWLQSRNTLSMEDPRDRGLDLPEAGI